MQVAAERRRRLAEALQLAIDPLLGDPQRALEHPLRELGQIGVEALALVAEPAEQPLPRLLRCRPELLGPAARTSFHGYSGADSEPGECAVINPLRIASATAWARVRAPSFAFALRTCVWTVAGESASMVAI